MGVTTRGARLTFDTGAEILETFKFVDCWSCGLVFGMPADFVQRRRDDGRRFDCPNGHGNYFTDTKEEKLQRKLDAAERRAQWRKEELDAARAIARSERQRAAAYKGHLTRMRNRVENGLCPKAGCRRSFTQLHDHIRTCHPELVDRLDDLI